MVPVAVVGGFVYGTANRLLIPLGLQEGDSIEVTGEIALFNTQVQIVNPRVAQNIKRGAAVPAPVVRTTGTLAGITSGTSAA